MTNLNESPSTSGEAIQPTPLHAAAASLSMRNAWTTRGQYTLADVYTDIDEEYLAVRNGVAVCDHSPLYKYRVSGHDSAKFLDRLVTRRIDNLEVGQSAFSPICDDRGHVIDFARIFRMGFGEFVIHTTLSIMAWLRDTGFGFTDLVIEEITAEFAIIGLHGTPSSFAGLLVGLSGIEQLVPGEIRSFRAKDINVHVERSRNFGELGYSIWVKCAVAVILWERLFRAARKLSIKPFGVAAQDICRVEAGHLSPNVDFIGAHSAQFSNRPRNPFELGLENCVDLTKEHFVGSSALAKKEIRTRVVGLLVDSDVPVTGGRVMNDTRLVGSISSSCWSPRLGRVIALATVTDGHCALGSQLLVEASDSVELEPITRRAEAIVTDRRFYASPARDASMGKKI